MSAPKLTLYAESGWVSPWVLHVMVALEEKGLPYQLELVPFPIPEPRRVELRERALLAKVPVLVDGDAWLTESLAISEYLAERYPAPAFPRLFPADLVQRARARQVLSALRRMYKGDEQLTVACLTGHVSHETELMCRKAGFDLFLMKPVSFDRVRDALAGCRALAAQADAMGERGADA